MMRFLIDRLPVAFILLLAALLRFYNISGQSLWADEGNSVALARRSFAEITQRTAFDIHPPLYYWLLKLWITLFGDTELGLRSLSAVLGIGLVYLIWLIGSRFFKPRVGLSAALIAAISPLQVYYAQETRMYMLLTFLAALTVLAALLIFEAGPRNRPWLGLIYMMTVAAGLYTHYAYPLILVAVNLVALPWFVSQGKGPRNLIFWLGLQLIPLLLYLPWLPIAWRQMTTWPAEQQPASPGSILNQVSTTLLFGLSWPDQLEIVATLFLTLLLISALILYILYFKFQVIHQNYLHNTDNLLPRNLLGYSTTPGISPSGRNDKVDHSRNDRLDNSPFTFYILRFTSRSALALSPFSISLLWLWLLLPMLLTILIFSPAFLKFLLVAAPAVALLLAVTVEQLGGLFRRTWPGYLMGGLLLASLISGSSLALYSYFSDAAYARDDYRSIVQFIKAVGGPEDAVVLHAEGQQDVFNYYYGSKPASEPPVYPLPRRRPLDEAATLAELNQIAGSAEKVYAVFWAGHQADPDRLIERWLDRQLFKATDQWYGNVRLASYASPQASEALLLEPVGDQLGQQIALTAYGLSSSTVVAGDILQVALQWQTGAPLTTDYVVFLQLLDQHNHLVSQRDASPVAPTSTWPIHQPISDSHGIFIEPGTPPGKHRLIVGLYDLQTGQRLPVRKDGKADAQGDFIELTGIEVTRPDVPLPAGAFDIQIPARVSLLDLSLLGYDLYKLGHRSAPDAPLYPGDPVQLVVYWRLDGPGQRLKDQLFIQLLTMQGEDTAVRLTAPLAGVHYPIENWEIGEIVRAQYDFFLNDLEPDFYRLALSVEGQEAEQQAEFVTKPFQLKARP